MVLCWLPAACRLLLLGLVRDLAFAMSRLHSRLQDEVDDIKDIHVELWRTRATSLGLHALSCLETTFG